MRLSAGLLALSTLLQSSFAGETTNHDVTTFEEDIIPTNKSVSAAYGTDLAVGDTIVEMDIMDGLKERGSSTSVELWKQKWNAFLEMWEVFVYFQPQDYTELELKTLKRGFRKFQKKSAAVKFTFLNDLPTDGTPFLHAGTFGSDTCSSFVGVDESAYTADGQFLFLGPSCLRWGKVHHELMHAMGFYHEHSRPDRDDFVTVNNQFIEVGQEVNFQIELQVDTLGTDYDYDSIMHYGEFQFTSDPTQKTIDAKGNAVGQRDKMSWGDIIEMRLLYQCKTGPSKFLCQFVYL